MKPMLYDMVARHRPLFLSVAALCVALSALASTHLRTDMSSASFFPDTKAEIRHMAQALDLVPTSSLLFVNFSRTPGTEENTLARAADAVVEALVPDLAQKVPATIPDAQSLLSLAPYFTDVEAADALARSSDKEEIETAVRNARKALGNIMASGPAAAWLLTDPLRFREIVLRHVASMDATTLAPDPAVGYPMSGDRRNLLLVLRPNQSLHDVEGAQRIVRALDAVLKRCPQGIEAFAVGGHCHTAANATAISRDVTRIVIFSIAGFLGVYLLLVRSWGMLWLLLVPFCATSLALGSMSLATGTLSGLALGFGASVLGIAEDYAVHTHFALRSGQNPSDTLQHIAKPLFQGYLVNISGFAVLSLSGIPALRQLAVFALLTLSFGFLLALLALPHCPGIAFPRFVNVCARVAPRRPRFVPLIFCALGLLLACVYLFSLIRVDVSPRSMGAGVATLQDNARKLKETWGIHDREMLLAEGKNIAEALERARRTATLLRAKQPGNAVSTLPDIWPAPETWRANVRRWREFTHAHAPQLKEYLAAAAAEQGFTPDAFHPFLSILEKDVPPFGAETLVKAGFGDLLKNYLVVPPEGGDMTNILIISEEKPDMSLLPPELAAHVLPFSPGLLEKALFAHFSAEKRLVPLAWLFCAVLLLLFFRSFQTALLASLPPLCSIVCILAWAAATGHAITLASMAAMPLVLGLAADHGIVVTHDLLLGVRLGVQRAVLVSSLTALTGMGLLALAEHPALRAMGEVIFWGLLVEVPASLWLLPRLCRQEKTDAA